MSRSIFCISLSFDFHALLLTAEHFIKGQPLQGTGLLGSADRGACAGGARAGALRGRGHTGGTLDLTLQSPDFTSPADVEQGGSQGMDTVVRSPLWDNSTHCHSCKDRQEGERQGSLGGGGLVEMMRVCPKVGLVAVGLEKGAEPGRGRCPSPFTWDHEQR